jgi:hypothetical protein
LPVGSLDGRKAVQPPRIKKTKAASAAFVFLNEISFNF